MRELIKEIWSTSKRNRLRTALTGFAVAWGIFMLIFLLGAGNGLINAQMERSEKYITNSMVVMPGYTSKAYKGLKEGREITLNDRDLAITGDNYAQHVDHVGGVLSQYGVTVAYGENYVATQNLVGIYPTHVNINKTEMLAGRFINEPDFRERRKVVVLSRSQAKELCHDYRSLIDKNVNINGLAFKVVGITKDDESRKNNELFTAFTTLKAIYAKGDNVDNIEFSIQNRKTKEDNEKFEANYRASTNLRHQAAPDDEQALWMWNRYTDSLTMAQGIGMIRTALWIVGLFTLLSGIVGVSNIMLITVKERTREFGIRKAIGARPKDILMLIIAESIIITSVFGYIGMLCGILTNLYMDATMGHMVMDSGIFRATMFVDPTVGLEQFMMPVGYPPSRLRASGPSRR